MSSHAYAPALHLECRAIPLLQALYLGMAALAILSLILLPWPWWLRLFAVLGLLWPLWRVWTRRGELGGPRLALHWDEGGQWWLEPQAVLLELDREHLLATHWTILRFRPVGGGWRGRFAVILTPGMLGQEDYRRLGLRLRYAEEKPQGNRQA
ncbi:MAG: protein YgfX [Thiohalomonadaceae bacterium]